MNPTAQTLPEKAWDLFKRLWSSVEFKLVLAWLFVVIATALLDSNHTYWNDPRGSSELIIRRTVLLGFFALTGIVVNDSIVLISVFKEDREKGLPIPEALEHAITSRFRAVMLTSLTTVVGLASLMFVTSTLAFMVAPIAVTLCFGLTFATALVLFVIPALIVLLERFSDWLKTRRTPSTDLIEMKGETA